MRLAAVQHGPSFGKVRSNLRRVEALIGGLKADLLVLPELFSTGYAFRSKKELSSLAETLSAGVTVAWMRALAKRTGGCVVGGFPERHGGKLYNAALTVSARSEWVYRKTHLFADEKKIFSPGDTGFRVHRSGAARIGVMVCFDWFFPESVRTLALRGADVVAHPANLVLPWCPDAMPIRCLENRVFSVTANRTGRERGLRFIGRSRIVGPDGGFLAEAGGDEDVVLTADIRPADARNKRINRLNDLFKDRRPAFYAAGTGSSAR